MSLIQLYAPFAIVNYVHAYPATVEIISLSADDFLISHEVDHTAFGSPNPYQFIGQLVGFELGNYYVLAEENYTDYYVLAEENYTGWGDLYDTTPLANGGFALSWVHQTNAQNYETHVQLFDDSATATGATFSFGSASTDNALTQLTGGNLAVVYENTGGTYLQIVDSQGASVLGATQISTQTRAEITALNSGGFAVLFQNQMTPTVRFFDASGTALTVEIPVPTHSATFNINAELTTLASGDVLVVWEASGAQGPDDFGVYGRIFDANGTPQGDAFVVSEDPDTYDGAPNVTALQDGGFLISYTSTVYVPSFDSTSLVQRFDAQGYKIGHPYEVTAAGGTQVSMAQNGYDQIYATYAGGQSVMLQVFDAGAYGDGADNVLTGATGDDVIFGLGGADRLAGLAGDDTLAGGLGNDVLFGNAGHDALEGCDGADRLLGSAGDDLLRGGAGNDVLNGGRDDDTLWGGIGRDTLTGGMGNDIFRFVSPADSTLALGGRDVILDFEDGVDLIDLSLIDAGPGLGDQAFTFIGTSAYSGTGAELRYTQTPNTTVLRADIDGDGQDDLVISVRGFNSFDATDFIL